MVNTVHVPHNHTPTAVPCHTPLTTKAYFQKSVDFFLKHNKN